MTKRSPGTGLLLLYLLSRRALITQLDGTQVEHEFLPVPIPPIGLGISFPFSDWAESVTYVVNSIYDGDAAFLAEIDDQRPRVAVLVHQDRKSTRLNSSH